MQRICFCKTLSIFNHILQPSQGLALFYQTLIFSLKNFLIIKWISFNIDIPIGLQLLMIDINGNITIDNQLLYKQYSNIKHHFQEQKNTTSILKWISRIILRLVTDCSVSIKSDRSIEFEKFNKFLKQFHSITTDDRSTLSDDDDDDLDEDEISRRAIYQALIKCIEYTTKNSFDSLNLYSNLTEMQNFESNPIGLYNQQIIQILCSDTLELEIELTRELRQSSFEFLSESSTNNQILINYYSVWADLWRNVTNEYLQFNNKKTVKNFELKNFKNENNFCLHDRLMFEIKQKQQLKPIQISLTNNSDQTLVENTSNSDNRYVKKCGVSIVDCLLESSSSDNEKNSNFFKNKNINETNEDFLNISNNNKTLKNKFDYQIIKTLQIEHISMEKLRLMKDSSDVLSLTYDEFCHIRNVITRAELETLLFDEKLYTEVAQSKLCFTCRKVHFNLLKFTFGIQCNVCKQKVCRNCATQIALPKERLNDLPIQSFSSLTLTKPLLNSDRCHSLDTQTPSTPTMNDIINDDIESRRCSTPGNHNNNQWQTEPIDICTDCFFLLQQIRKKTRQRHISPGVTSNLISSSSFNRSSSRSTSNYNLSSSSSTSSLAAILVQQHQQRSLMVKATSFHNNLKSAKSAQDLSINNDPLQTLTIANRPTTERVSLSRHHLFLKLQPTYDMKLNNIKTE